jgi:hypothetical protein
MAIVQLSTLKSVIMARFFKYLPFYFFTFLLFSCQEGRDAGDLLGQWRVAGSDTKYISFSGSIAWIKDLQGSNVYGNFQHVGDSLFIQCYSINGIPEDTVLVENTFGFRPFNNIRVKIETLSSDRLQLRQDNQTWTLDKY